MLLRWNIFFSLERAVEHRTVFVCDVILCWYGVELAAKQAHQGAVDVHVVGGGGDHGRVRGQMRGGVLKQDLSAGSKRILINSCRSPTWSERARPLRQGRGVAGGGASGSALVQSPRLRVRSPGPTLLLLQPQEWLWYTYPTDYTRLASLYCTAPLTY